MKYKFWFINIVAILIILVYLFFTIYELVNGGNYYGERAFYEATVFQLCVLGCLSYLLLEGMLVHKTILAKKISDDETVDEFGVIDKSYKKSKNFVEEFVRKRG